MSLRFHAGINCLALSTTGAPSTGTWKLGDVVCDSAGAYWRCTVAGTPGTWAGLGGAEFTSDRGVVTGKAVESTDSRLRNPFSFNYIKNPDGEADASTDHAGWLEYADAAGTQPVDGSGGSPTSTLLGYDDTTLRGSRSFRYVKVTGASRQGEGFSYDFTIDGADANRALTVAFEVRVHGGVYTAGDMTVWVYDVTNAKLCPINSNSIAGSGKFSAQFSASDSTSYRLCFHVSTTYTGEWQLRFDDFYVGPTYLPGMPAMSDWQDGGAITITATTTNPTKGGTVARDKVSYRRCGDEGSFRYEYEQTSGGSAGSGDYLFALPAGLSFGPLVEFFTGTLGEGTDSRYNRGGCFIDQTTIPIEGYIVPYDATRFRLRAYTLTGTAGYTMSSAAHGLSTTTVRFYAEFTAPISGWSGSVAVQPGSRYLWAQRFAANAVRVTTTPSKPGEYRARRLGTDTAPTTVPSVADGITVERGSGIAAGSINLWDIYLGPGKVVQPQFYLSAGRTGFVWTTMFVNGGASDSYNGALWSYDPVTGVATVWCFDSTVNAGINASGAGASTFRMDWLVADDPVPVALAPAVHVDATTTAGQVLTASVTNIIWGTKSVDTHGAMNTSTGVFTAPVAGKYLITESHRFGATAGAVPLVYKGGVFQMSGSIAGGAGQTGNVAATLQLAAGETITIRDGGTAGVALSTTANFCRLQITRVGD